MVDYIDNDASMDDVDMTVDRNDNEFSNFGSQADGSDPSPRLPFPNHEPASSSKTSSSTSNQRYSAWVLLTISNVVSIIAIALRQRKGTTAEKWAIAIISISLAFSALSFIGHHVAVARAIFVSGPIELRTSTLLFLLWCAGLAIIMNPSHSIAVGYTQIVNGNLYVGAWISFLCLCWIQNDLWGQRYNYSLVGVFYQQSQIRQGKWNALLAASLVVVGSSVRVFQSFECDSRVMKASPVCLDSRVAIAVAVVASFIAMIVTILGCFVSPSVLQIGEYVGAFLMLGFWSVGLGFITFGEGPGHSIGNLFFATWTAFLLSGWIAGDCFRECRSTRNAESSSPSVKEEEQTEMPQYSSTRPPMLKPVHQGEAVQEVEDEAVGEIL